MDSRKRVKICKFLRNIWPLIAVSLLFLGMKIVVLLLDLYVYAVKYINMITSAAEVLVIVAVPLLFVSGIIVGLKTFINNNAEDPKDFVKGMEAHIKNGIIDAKEASKRIIKLFITVVCFSGVLTGIIGLIMFENAHIIGF